MNAVNAFMVTVNVIIWVATETFRIYEKTGKYRILQFKLLFDWWSQDVTVASQPPSDIWHLLYMEIHM